MVAWIYLQIWLEEIGGSYRVEWNILLSKCSDTELYIQLFNFIKEWINRFLKQEITNNNNNYKF